MCSHDPSPADNPGPPDDDWIPTDDEGVDMIVDGENVVLMRLLVYKLQRERDGWRAAAEALGISRLKES